MPEAPQQTNGNALLIGDTSAWYHWGCSCTSIGLHDELRRRWRSVSSIAMHRLTGLAALPATVEQFDDEATFEAFCSAHPSIVDAMRGSDRVYINGEGTLHGTGPSALALLFLARIASIRLGREVHLINHSCFPDGAARLVDSPAAGLYRRVYSDLAFVAVRERISHALLGDMGIDAAQAFDCLPLFAERHYERREGAGNSRRVVIAGSVAWGAGDASGRIAEFVRQLAGEGFEPGVLLGASRLMASDDIVFVERLTAEAGGSFDVHYAASEAEWLRIIDESAALISGRFHHSIAAAFLDTPFVVMESNTPKISGLLEMLGVDAFVSVEEPKLVEVLSARLEELVADPSSRVVGDHTKEELLALARENFR